MSRDAGDPPAGSCAAPLKLEGKQQAGELRLRIHPHGLVVPLGLEIVEVDRALACCDTGHIDDPWGIALEQQWQQLCGQHKVTEIVRTELQFKPIGGGLALRRRHHRCVVDEYVESLAAISQALSTASDRIQPPQVNFFKLYLRTWYSGANLFDCRCAFGRVAASNRDIGPCLSQSQRILKAQPTRAGDQDRAAVLRRNIRCGPVSHSLFSFVVDGILNVIIYALGVYIIALDAICQ